MFWPWVSWELFCSKKKVSEIRFMFLFDIYFVHVNFLTSFVLSELLGDYVNKKKDFYVNKL